LYKLNKRGQRGSSVDQPVVEVDRREVDKMFGSHLPTMVRSPKQNKQFYKKRGQ